MSYRAQRSIQSRLLIAALTLTAMALAFTAVAAESNNASTGLTLAGGPLAIHGYDPVAYFTDGSASRGQATFSAKHDGVVYRFVSKDNLKQFKRSPSKYAPQFGGFCAYGVSVGKKFDGDPEVFKIVGGKLYFNLNPDVQVTWEKDLEDNISKADRKWQSIRDKAVGSL